MTPSVATASGKLRRSALEAFASCPHNFYQHYIKGIEDTSDPALRGTAYHEAKRRYVTRLAEKGLPSDFEEAQIALAETLRTATVPLRVLQDVESVFLRMAQDWSLDTDAFLLAEEVQDDDVFEWTPDAVYARERELEIEDDKTFWTVFTPAQVASNFQARFYIWRAMQRWPNFPSYRFTFYFPRFNQKVSHVWSAAEMELVERDVRVLVDQIKDASARNVYPATPGTQCAVCSYTCPIADQPAFLPARIQSRTEWETLAAQYLVAERDQKARYQVLRAFAEQAGPTTMNGVEFKMDVAVSRRFPIESVLNVLAAEGKLTILDPEKDRCPHSVVDTTTDASADCSLPVGHEGGHNYTDRPWPTTPQFTLESPFSVSASSLTAYLKTKKRAAVGAKLIEVAAESPSARFVHTKAYSDPAAGDDETSTESAT